MFILLCGTGVGFSVERQYIDALPTIPADLAPSDDTIVVQDSKRVGLKHTASSSRSYMAVTYHNGTWTRYVQQVRD